uniref:Uncharacterized protein n=1 Tax=Rhizophora mucronata TaxID=61149 RepID=A0A2P2Q3L3_RHIMU
MVTNILFFLLILIVRR